MGNKRAISELYVSRSLLQKWVVGTLYGPLYGAHFMGPQVADNFQDMCGKGCYIRQ